MPKYLVENLKSSDISNWCRECLCESANVITIGFNKVIVEFMDDKDKALFALKFGEYCKELDSK